MFSADWLSEAAHSAVQIACIGIWTAGCVLALRNRPAAGTAFAAAGFGLLAFVQVLSLVMYLAFLLQVQLGGSPTSLNETLWFLAGGLTGIGQIAGTALVVAGASSAWQASRRETSPADIDS